MRVEQEVEVRGDKTYVLESKNLTAFAAGAKADGAYEKAGTEDYFTLYYSAKTKIDKSGKDFDDGYTNKDTEGQLRINFGGALDTATPKNAISFKTQGAATVKVWWVQGGTDSRQVVIKNGSGTEIDKTTGTWTQNSPYISTLNITTAGTYFLGGLENNNNFYKVQVTEGGGTVVRGDWSDVAAPSITGVTQTAGKNEIVVAVTGDVGTNGGDAVVVTMYDSDNNVVATKQSLAEKSSHSITFTASATGTYTFKAELTREGEESKAASGTGSVDFVLPLGKPAITSATSKGAGSDGKGSIDVVWDAVPEATGYKIYMNGTEKGTATATHFTVTGLDIGTEYSFTVSALRGDSEEGSKSAAVNATATADAKTVWSSVYYGVSVSSSKNKTEGNVNEDGQVTVYATDGGGKIVGGGADGLTFYYTAVPDNKNFTLRANMHIDEWKYSNGQEAMGLMVSDSVPANGTNPYWTNVYYMTVGTVAYYWDEGKVNFNNQGTKYDMRCGVGVYPKLGITPENQSSVGVDANLTKTIDPGIQYTLETSAANSSLEAGRYNLAAGSTNPADTPTLIGDGISDFILEIQRNNTGYFFTYYAQDGTTVIGKQKFYDTEALSALDTENVYVGFFAARNAKATFSNVTLTTINPEDDAPAEERPVEKVPTLFTITSAPVANSSEYTLMASSNVSGKADIRMGTKYIARNAAVTAGELFTLPINIKSGKNYINVTFTPDPDQDLGEYRVLESTEPVEASITVNYDTYYQKQNNIYVSPKGQSSGNGGPDDPVDIYTAVSLVRPGQTIVIMEGTYSLFAPVRIERGMNGTAEEPIRMIVDPEAETRPVFDFNKYCEGFRLGGNYWYIGGFDVTNSADKSTGFRVCGNNNTIDQLILHDNGNTGLQISAFRDSSDTKDMWPCNNLILNCTSYNNADAGYEDADGFAAKLTCGEGNVFDGCVSHHNADDGWDLYARTSSGSIGTVTIRNCVAYSNGRMLDGTKAGNGNGFKLGGENLPGGHVLENSIAFDNEADGITSNSCPDVKVINCTAYNNKKNNLNLYTNLAGNTTAFTVQGLVSCGAANTVKKNSTDTSDLEDPIAKTVTDADFESTTFAPADTVTGIDRNSDGTINLGDFLKLKDGSGADMNNGSSSNIPDSIAPDTNLPGAGGHRDIVYDVVTPDDTKPEDPTTPTEPSKPAEPVVNPEDGSATFEHEATDIEVTAPKGAFDGIDEIRFNADPVPEDTNEEQVTFDLNFTDGNGNKLQPKIAVTVKIPVPTIFKGKTTLFVYHVEDNGKYTQIDCKVENGMVVFTASKFSKYIITSEKLAGANVDGNPSTGVALPLVNMAVVIASGAAVLFTAKRKRG